MNTHTNTQSAVAGSSTGEAGVLDPDDPRRHLASAVTTATEVLGGITPDQRDLPTPCDKMTVRELSEHLVMALRRVACAGRAEPPDTWPLDAVDVPEGGWTSAFTEAAHDVQGVWGDDILDRPTALPWGTFAGREVLGIYTNELVVHTWDLARATGQHPSWDQDALDFAYLAIHDQLPMADRTPMWQPFQDQLPPGVAWEAPFGPAVEIAENAPLIERLVAWNGRTP